VVVGSNSREEGIRSHGLGSRLGQIAHHDTVIVRARSLRMRRRRSGCAGFPSSRSRRGVVRLKKSSKTSSKVMERTRPRTPAPRPQSAKRRASTTGDSRTISAPNTAATQNTEATDPADSSSERSIRWDTRNARRAH
jgi:hypothetical protein